MKSLGNRSPNCLEIAPHTACNRSANAQKTLYEQFANASRRDGDFSQPGVVDQILQRINRLYIFIDRVNSCDTSCDSHRSVDI